MRESSKRSQIRSARKPVFPKWSEVSKQEECTTANHLGYLQTGLLRCIVEMFCLLRQQM